MALTPAALRRRGSNFVAPSICAWPLSEFSYAGMPITPCVPNPGSVRANIVVIGDRQVVEPAHGRLEEPLPDFDPECVELVWPGVVVVGPAVRVVRIARVDVQIAGQPLTVGGLQRRGVDRATEPDHHRNQCTPPCQLRSPAHVPLNLRFGTGSAQITNAAMARNENTSTDADS